MRGKIITLALVAVLVAAPLLANTAYAEKEKGLKGREERGRLTVSNGDLTVIATAEGKHPQFFWYANSQNNTIYQVKYKGIIEYLDTGQEIFQRKFKAELGKFLKAGESAIKEINASKVGKNMTIAGTIRENRDRQTERLFNYLFQEGSSRIGVNVSKDTKVSGELRGDVVVEGIVAVQGQTFYIKAISISALENIRSQLRQLNPPFFEFNQGKWTFSGFQPIRAGDKVIGYQFNYTLSDINGKQFENLKNQIVIRNRLYNTTVREGDTLVPTASMKSDIIIKSWRWNLNTTAAKILNIDLTKDKLALWLELTAFKGSKIDDAVEEKAKPSLTEVRTGKERIETKENKTAKGEDEKKLEADKDQHKLTMLSDNQVLGGYFNFTNAATVYAKGSSPAQGQSVKVDGSYIGDQNKIRVYILYPNFGAKSLEHDPSIGVTPTEPVNVQYAVDPVALNAAQKAPALGAPAPQPVQPVQVVQPVQPGQPVQPAPSPQQSAPPQPSAGPDNTMVIIGVAVAVIIVGAIAALARRKK